MHRGRPNTIALTIKCDRFLLRAPGMLCGLQISSLPEAVQVIIFTLLIIINSPNISTSIDAREISIEKRMKHYMLHIYEHLSSLCLGNMLFCDGDTIFRSLFFQVMALG